MAENLHTFNGNEIIATEVPKYLNDNFSALNSVDEDIKTQLGAKAPLASPTLTGTPKAPTASQGTNTTQIATTAFVASAVKVKSVNGKTGDVVVGKITDASISGKVITLTFADGTTKTLTTQDTDTLANQYPNYSAGVSKTSGTQYTAETDGFIMLTAYHDKTAGTTIEIIINGVTLGNAPTLVDWGSAEVYMPIKKGTKYKLTCSSTRLEYYFYPMG